jgi:magnesium transporter
VIHTVFELPDHRFKWLDIVNPTEKELRDVASQYGLHWTSVHDCLQPVHLPKFERVGALTFMVTRAYDEAADKDADTVQELTRKVALFLGERFLITIHRQDQPFLAELRNRWQNPTAGPGIATDLVGDLLRQVLLSYERPLQDAIAAFEEFETRIFQRERESLLIEEIYFLKRKASVFKRMLHLTIDVVPRLGLTGEHAQPLLQDLKDEAQRLWFYADELLENTNSLLNLHISLVSHRTNEVMRLLTVFSVFFLPLTFIVGVYGMNFEYMPELKSRAGYPLVWLVMLGVSFGIFLWVRRKGWLR